MIVYPGTISLILTLCFRIILLNIIQTNIFTNYKKKVINYKLTIVISLICHFKIIKKLFKTLTIWDYIEILDKIEILGRAQLMRWNFWKRRIWFLRYPPDSYLYSSSLLTTCLTKDVSYYECSPSKSCNFCWNHDLPVVHFISSIGLGCGHFIITSNIKLSGVKMERSKSQARLVSAQQKIN